MSALESSVARLRATLTQHAPADETETDSVSEVLAFLDTVDDPFDHASATTHVTASAIVIDYHQRILVHRHKRLGLWLQPGGHISRGEAPDLAARRETLEETGVQTALVPAPACLIHVDAHDGPRGHRHLDLRYLLRPVSTHLAPAVGESQEVAWVRADDERACTDHSLIAGVNAALRQLSCAR